MNYYAIKAIYLYEMSRTYRTISQSLIAPVISTILYFVVFGYCAFPLFVEVTARQGVAWMLL